MANGTGYSAGNLEFTVQTISNETLNSLDRLNAKLGTTMSLLGSTSSITKMLGSATGRTSGGGASFNNKNHKETNKELKVSSITISKMLNKVYFLRNYTKQMFASMKKVFDYAVEYTETLNLWQVAMRNNRQEADEFVKTMNKAYGISTQTLMNYQAIFRNMLSSLGGISENTSYALSEYLTQMAVDYASLYNTSIDRAMTTFQAVLSGQVRPIRSIAGYDITETTIFQLYQQLGGTKTMRQLTQTEKRLLRIYAVFQQMESSGAIGDLNRTLGNTANQMRIMSEASKELQTWFGLIMEDIFKPALPIINAFLITLTNITKAIAKMRGVQLFEGGAVESVKELNSELDNMQGKLLSFDRFEALSSNEDSGNNLLGIDENLLNGLSRYKSLLSEVTGEAQDLAEEWTNLFINAETGEFTELAKNVIKVLEFLPMLLATIITIKKPSLGIIGALMGLYATNEDFRDTINRTIPLLMDFTKSMIPLVQTLVSLFSTIFDILSPLLSLVSKLNDFFVSVNNSWLSKFGNWLSGIFSGGNKSYGGFGGGGGGSFKNGGRVEDGVFTMSKGEIIGNFDDGTTVVANNQQIIAGIQQGVYTAVASAMRQSGGAGIGDVILDGRKVGYTTAKYSHQENVRSGYVRATR